MSNPQSHQLSALLGRHRTGAAVTIGVFDGVHAGHQALLAATARLARERGLATVAVTFSPRPDEVFHGEDALPGLCSIEDRVNRLRRAGADDVVVIPFSCALAEIPAEEFASALVTDLGLEVLCVGPDFALGQGRRGTVEFLRGLGLKVFIVPFVLNPDGRSKISSSGLRREHARGRQAALVGAV